MRQHTCAHARWEDGAGPTALPPPAFQPCLQLNSNAENRMIFYFLFFCSSLLQMYWLGRRPALHLCHCSHRGFHPLCAEQAGRAHGGQELLCPGAEWQQGQPELWGWRRGVGTCTLVCLLSAWHHCTRARVCMQALHPTCAGAAQSGSARPSFWVFGVLNLASWPPMPAGAPNARARGQPAHDGCGVCVLLWQVSFASRLGLLLSRKHGMRAPPRMIQLPFPATCCSACLLPLSFHESMRRVAMQRMLPALFRFPPCSCIAYLIIVGDSFRPLLLEAFGATWWTTRTATICGIGCAIILPLSFKTRLGALKGACRHARLCAGLHRARHKDGQPTLAPGLDLRAWRSCHLRSLMA